MAKQMMTLARLSKDAQKYFVKNKNTNHSKRLKGISRIYAVWNVLIKIVPDWVSVIVYHHPPGPNSAASFASVASYRPLELQNFTGMFTSFPSAVFVLAAPTRMRPHTKINSIPKYTFIREYYTPSRLRILLFLMNKWKILNSGHSWPFYIDDSPNGSSAT